MSNPGKKPAARTKKAGQSKKAAAKKRQTAKKAAAKKRTGRRPAGERPDWGKIEAEWRAGVLSIEQLAKKHGLAQSTVSAYMKRRGIERDISDDVRRRAAQKLAEKRWREANPGATESDIADATEAAADLQALVIERHRGQMGRYLGLGERLMEQVRQCLEQVDQAVQAAIDERQREVDEQQARLAKGQKLRKGETRKHSLTPWETLRLRASLLDQVADIYRKTSPPIARYIELERQAYSLDAHTVPSSLEQLMSELETRTENNPISRIRSGYMQE